MIKKRGFKTYEEAVKEAEALLWKNRDGEELILHIQGTGI